MENKIPVIMLFLLLAFSASSTRSKSDPSTHVASPTVTGFYDKLLEVEQMATRIDDSIKKIEIARDTQHIATTDTTRGR